MIRKIDTNAEDVKDILKSHLAGDKTPN